MSHLLDIKQALEDVSSGIADLGDMLSVEERRLAQKRSDFDRFYAARLQASLDAKSAGSSTPLSDGTPVAGRTRSNINSLTSSRDIADLNSDNASNISSPGFRVGEGTLLDVFGSL